MVRPFRLAVAGLLLFLAAAGLGVRAASHWGPERTRAALARSLSEALGGPVDVGQARLYFGGGALSWLKGVLLDARDIEAMLAPQPGVAPDGTPQTTTPELAVERLQAELDPLALLRGQIEMRSLALDGMRVSLSDELRARAAVAAGPPAVGAGEPGPAEPPEPVLDWLEGLAESGERLLRTRARTDDVSIERATITLDGPPLAEGAPPWRAVLRDVSGELRLREPGRRARIALVGRLDDGQGEARVALELERKARGALHLELSVTDLALASTRPVLGALLHGAELTGRGTVSLSARRAQRGVWHLAARADAQDVAGTLPRMGDAAPVPVALARASAGIELDVDPERVRVERAFARSEHTVLGLSGEIERPLRMASSTVGEFVLDHYDMANRDDLIAFLPPRQMERIQTALLPLRSGRIEDARVAGKARLRDWLRAFDSNRQGLLPETVEARARFQGFAVHAGEDETIGDLSGRVVWRGDRIELQGVHGRRAGHELPVLDASLEGMSNLAANADFPEIPDDDGAPHMLGLRPMYDIVVDPTKPPGEMPRELMLALDYVVHPTLVWPLRNLFARANPGEDGIRLLLEHGVWGQVPIRAEGIWTMQRDAGQRRVERVAVRIEAKPPLEGLEPLDRDDPVWARGRWHLDAHNLGDWRVLASSGAFRASGQDVRLVSYDLELGIAGRALGEGTIDFSKPDELPYWTTVRVVDAKAPGIVDKIGFEPHEATGDVVLDGQFHGELRPGRRVLAGMEGRLQVAARDGAIRKRLPVLLAMAKATDTFNPFGSRNEMRYSEIDASLRLERGMVHAEELRINGSDLRLLATGHVDALDPRHPVEAVVGIFFFKALDRVIGVVPVLSDLLLGEDHNLVGAYVEVTGPWADPGASLVPLKTVTSGPASFAMEGVPRFVRKAIIAIQAALDRPTPDVAAPPPPPPQGEDS